MNNADSTFDWFAPRDAKPSRPATVEDLLCQLDRVAQPSGAEFDQDGLDQLMAWMAADDPKDRDVPDHVEDVPAAEADSRGASAKIIVAGGERAGATEFINQVSDIGLLTEILDPEETSSSAPQEVSFGRLTLPSDLHLYQVAAPNPVRPFVWNWCLKNGVGALVLADYRHMTDCYDALNYLDHCGMPYVLVLRGSPERCPYDLTEIREALRLLDNVPLLFWEPEQRTTAMGALIAVLERAMEWRASLPQADKDLDEELKALALLTQLELLMQ
ncbi:hypothetical protein [Streptomyces mirabilis]|uniref:hypothetical protein n=1 Tax=Streptomyces mirabilis TaxID=68239 RepID=UPI0036DA8BC1